MKTEVVIDGVLCVVEYTIFGFAIVSLVVGALFGVSGCTLAYGAEFIKESRKGKGEEIDREPLISIREKLSPIIDSLSAAVSFSNHFNGRSDAPTKKDVDDLASDTDSEEDKMPSEDEPEELGVENSIAAKRKYEALE